MTTEQNIDNSEDTPELKTVETEAGSAEVNELETLRAQLNESNDKFLRLYAEFDNYKRRTLKERAELIQTAGKEIILAMLPVIDDFERANKSENLEIEAYREGIRLIHHKFNAILESKGLKPIQSIGQPFNVDIHEAITTVPATDEDMKGKVMDEAEKGYALNGQVIRFAKVIIGG